MDNAFQCVLLKHKDQKEEISWATVFGKEMPCQREGGTSSKLFDM